MSDQKVDPESRNYSFDQIEDDPRLKRTTKEFFITIGVYAIYAALMILNLYIFGSKDPSTYKYILGFPQWIFNLVCLLIGMVITVELVTTFVYKDMDITPTGNIHGTEKTTGEAE